MKLEYKIILEYEIIFENKISHIFFENPITFGTPPPHRQKILLLKQRKIQFSHIGMIFTKKNYCDNMWLLMYWPIVNSDTVLMNYSPTRCHSPTVSPPEHLVNIDYTLSSLLIHVTNCEDLGSSSITINLQSRLECVLMNQTNVSLIQDRVLGLQHDVGWSMGRWINLMLGCALTSFMTRTLLNWTTFKLLCFLCCGYSVKSINSSLLRTYLARNLP